MAKPGPAVAEVGLGDKDNRTEKKKKKGTSTRESRYLKKDTKMYFIKPPYPHVPVPSRIFASTFVFNIWEQLL